MRGFLEFLKTPLRFFSPSLCLLCDKPVDAEILVCRECEEKLSAYRIKGPRCYKCGGSMEGRECPRCRELKPVFGKVRAPFVYEGEVRRLISYFKFTGIEKVAKFMASNMVEEIESNYDILVPIPLHPTRKRERGFSQTFEIAKEISKITGIPLKEVLFRQKKTKSQTALGGKERRKNLKNAFKLKENVEGAKILLVDDVMTTGITINEAAKTLLKGGAEKVDGVVFAIASI